MSYASDHSWRTQRPGGIAAVDLAGLGTGARKAATSLQTKVAAVLRSPSSPILKMPKVTMPAPSPAPKTRLSDAARTFVRTDVALTKETAPSSVFTALLPTPIPQSSDKPGRTTTDIAIATPGGASPVPGSVPSGARIPYVPPKASSPSPSIDVGPISFPESEPQRKVPWLLIGGAALVVVFLVTRR